MLYIDHCKALHKMSSQIVSISHETIVLCSTISTTFFASDKICTFVHFFSLSFSIVIRIAIALAVMVYATYWIGMPKTCSRLLQLFIAATPMLAVFFSLCTLASANTTILPCAIVKFLSSLQAGITLVKDGGIKLLSYSWNLKRPLLTISLESTISPLKLFWVSSLPNLPHNRNT